MVRAAAAGVGNAVVLMGAATGRDGIGGASVLASAELGEGDEAKRPTVQIGDPFEESKLLECCLELLEKGLLVSLQDLGAAGLTSSAGEMASAGGVGIDIDVAAVPLREADMEPFEIMVSESQERMLAVVEPERVEEVRAICEKWQTGSAQIGVVTDSGAIRILRGGEVVGEMPVAALVDGCPLLRPRAGAAGGLDLRQPGDAGAGDERRGRAAGAAGGAQHRLQALGLRAVRLDRRLAHRAPARAGRRRRPAAARVRQRDRRLDRRQRPPGRLRPLRGHGRGGARVRPEPRLRRRRAARPDQLPQLRQPGEAGARLAARPRGQRPRRRLRRRSACRSSAATSRSTTRARTGRSTRRRWWRWSASCPTRPEVAGSGFAAAGDAIGLFGPFAPTLAGSELAKQRGELEMGLPRPDVAAVAAACAVLREAVRAGALACAHDVSDGGLACALAEAAIGGGLGCRVDLQPLRERGCSPEEALFGEGAGGFVLSGERAALEELGAVLIGEVGGTTIEIAAGDRSLVVGLDDAADAWRSLAERAEAVPSDADARSPRWTVSRPMPAALGATLGGDGQGLRGHRRAPAGVDRQAAAVLRRHRAAGRRRARQRLAEGADRDAAGARRAHRRLPRHGRLGRRDGRPPARERPHRGHALRLRGAAADPPPARPRRGRRRPATRASPSCSSAAASSARTR